MHAFFPFEFNIYDGLKYFSLSKLRLIKGKFLLLQINCICDSLRANTSNYDKKTFISLQLSLICCVYDLY